MLIQSIFATCTRDCNWKNKFFFHKFISDNNEIKYNYVLYYKLYKATYLI